MCCEPSGPTLCRACASSSPTGAASSLALEHDVRNVLYTIGATNSFNRRNVNRSVAESLDDLDGVVADAGEAGCTVDVAVSVSFGCPFEGDVEPQRVVDLCRELAVRGATEVGIADTIGVAHPAAVRELCSRVREVVPGERLSLHVHDTRGLGVANVLVAYESGVTRFDGSAGGLGGCPFAPRSTGNVCSEDALQAVASAGGIHGCDLAAYCAVSDTLAADLGLDLPGQAVSSRHLDGRADPGARRMTDVADREGTTAHGAGDLEGRLTRARAGGSEKARTKLRDQGKLMARERIEMLFDEGTEFVEDGLLANNLAGDLPADGVVTGVGTLGGRPCAVMANDPSVKAGSWGARTVEKIVRILETAERLQLPMIYLVDSAGARITDQVAMFPGRRHAGRIFRMQVRLSGQVPQLCVLFGPSAAGGAYIPAFCDAVIMVEGNASMYLGSPRMAEVVVGEKVTLEEMGGARMHCTRERLRRHPGEERTGRHRRGAAVHVVHAAVVA